MNPFDIKEITLDQSIYKKAYIEFRYKDGKLAKKYHIRWEKRFEALDKAVSNWNQAKEEWKKNE